MKNLFIILIFLLFSAHTIIFAQCNITGVSTDPDEPTMLCEEDTLHVQFSTTGTCTGNYEFRVSDLDNGTVLQNWSTTDYYDAAPTDSTNFLVEARCSACPATIVRDTFIVVVTLKPTITGITEICSGTSTALMAHPNGAESVSWWDDTTASGTQVSSTWQFTTPNLNDTTTYWVKANSTSSSIGGAGKILFAECGLNGAAGGTGSEDYIEVANLYNVPVNTNGWVVAVSSSYSNINSVNSTYWNLPTNMSPCSILVKTDDYGSANYWGQNILWDPPYNGWAIILDNLGNVIDFAVWGWTAADLATFNPTINGFSVTLGPEWTGDGMGLPCGSTAGVQYSFARNGSNDNNNNGDFFCQPTSVNILNPGLTCGWAASKSCYYPVKVLVNPTPELDPINDTTVCGSLTLDTIHGDKLTGNEAYYTQPNGNGTIYHAGDVITSSMTLYVYDSLQTPTGCTDEISFDISVTPNTINLNAGSDIEVCEGEQITLTATGAVNYSWDHGITNGTPFTPPVDTTKYVVVGTDGPCIAKDSLIVLVRPTPVVDAGNDTSVCELRTIKLVGSGAENYAWDNGVVNNVAFVPPVGNTMYHMVATDTYGCQNSDSVMVTVNPLPVVDFIADTLLGCDPFVVTFTNQSLENNTAASWFLSNGDTSTQLASFTTTLRQSGCYDVKLIMTSDKGCVDSLQKIDYVCVAPDPTASFYPDPFNLTTLQPVSTMMNTSTGATNYIWNFGDETPASIEVSPSHSFPAKETRPYEVTLTAITDKGCMDSVMHLVYVKELVLYYIPNAFTPDGDNINDRFTPVFNSGVDPQSYTLLIFNRWGEVLFESHNLDIGWDGTYNGKVVPEGIYVWKVSFKLKDNDAHHEEHGTVTLNR